MHRCALEIIPSQSVFDYYFVDRSQGQMIMQMQTFFNVRESLLCFITENQLKGI